MKDMKEKIVNYFNSSRKVMIYSIIAVCILLITVVGITYAWFSATANNTGSVTVTSGTLAVTYEQGTILAASNLKPATTSQVLSAYNAGNCKYNNEDYDEQICYASTFTVRNTGTLAAVVSSRLTNVTNTYSDNLLYQIFETTPLTLSGNVLSTNTVLSGFPNEAVIPAVTNNSKTYTILIWLDEHATNIDQNASYTATLVTNAVQTNQIKATIYSEVSRGTAQISNTYPNVGETITLTSSPKAGYALRSVSVLKETDNTDVTEEVNYNPTNNTLTMPSYSIKVLVVFDGTSGSTILTNGDETLVGVDKTSAMEGETVTLTANSNSSYLLKQISILKASDDTDITSIVNYNATNKTFEMPDYAVKVVIEYYITHAINLVNDSTKGSISSNKQSALIGDVITLTITPNTNYLLNTVIIKKTSDDSDVTSLVGYNNTTKTFTQNAGTQISIPVPTRTGYTFTGWTRSNTYGSITSLTTSATYTYGSTDGVTDTLTANWEIKANAPILASGMIPIKYDGSKWVKANTANTNNDWYNYNTTDKKWANAVMVTSTTRNAYLSDTTKPLGSEVLESDILAYYVWIPRYKYKLFNTAFAEITARSIEIDFEKTSVTPSNGTCNGTYSVPTDNCWYTHPAFTFGDKNLEGIWVGKFEVSSDTTCTLASNAAVGSGCNNRNYKPRIKPGVESWRGAMVSTYYLASKKIEADTTYLTTAGKGQVDSHMMKNIEWGAVAYLTYSTYGKNSEIAVNSNYPTYYTGGGSGNTYKTNLSQSTTGNIYGIYDMSGNTREYVMGVMKVSNSNNPQVGSQTTNNNHSGFNGTLYYNGSNYSSGVNLPDSKYYDLYNYTSSHKDYTRSHLGDATGETLKWNSDQADFVGLDWSWFDRGFAGVFGSSAGVFAFKGGYGYAHTDFTTRLTLTNK